MVLIEIGNTSVKAVRNAYTDRKLLFKVCIHQPEKLSNELLALPESERIILSSVRKDITDLVYKHSDRLSLFQIKTDNLGKVKLDYKTPETLGIDRVLACLGAAEHAAGHDVVVVDAGTACTIDYMTQNYVYKGGVIMPGLTLFKKSVRDFLPELPQVIPEIPDSFPGRSTDESVRWGMFGGFLNAVKSFVDRYQKMGSKSELYLTGGDGEFLSQNLKEYNCTYRENLVFDGMGAFIRINDINFDK